jgi:hypothetical protein
VRGLDPYGRVEGGKLTVKGLLVEWAGDQHLIRFKLHVQYDTINADEITCGTSKLGQMYLLSVLEWGIWDLGIVLIQKSKQKVYERVGFFRHHGYEPDSQEIQSLVLV